MSSGLIHWIQIIYLNGQDPNDQERQKREIFREHEPRSR